MIKGGPKIVTDGLVLCLDAHDAKSYAGEPVTNLYGDMSTSSSLRGNRTEYNTGGTWPSDMPMCPEPVGRVYKHTSGALTSSWSGNSYGYMHKDISTTSGLMYTLTCWVYLSPDCDIDYMFASIEGATSNYGAWTGYPNGYDFTKKGTWQLLSRHATADTSVRFLIYPGHTGVTDGSFSGFFAWGGMQVVQAEHVTPFVLSSRSATNGWVDRTTNNNDGTLVNGVNTGVSHYRDGQVIMPVANSYLDFDGSNDYITLPNDIGYTDAVSVFAWFKRDTNTGVLGGYHIICATTPLELSVNQGGNYLRNGIEVNGTRYVSNDGSAIGTGTWHYVGFTWSTSDYTKRSYVDGVQVGTQSTGSTGTSNYSFSGRSLGSWNGGTYALNGKIAVYQVYNKALTAAEVLSNYNATKERFS